MKMTSDDYRRFVCVVAGENPEKQMEPYDSKKEVEKYIVYKYADAEKLKNDHIKLCKSIIDNENIPEADKEETRMYLDTLLHTNADDFYYDITMEYDLDEDTGDAYSTKNKNGKWEYFGDGGEYAMHFILKDGETSHQAKKCEIDWDKIHNHGIETYKAAWETVMEGRKPENQYEEQIYNNMKNAITYFNKFETKENYIASCTAFWGYAFLSPETGWLELEPNVNQFEWMNNFYDRFIKPLPEDTLLTIFECKR